MTSRWMKAIMFWVFDHFANSPTNYCFFDTYLIVSYQKGEENCLLDVYFNTWTLCFYQERSVSVFRHGLASCLRNVSCLNLAFNPHRKNDISGYIWPRSFNQTVKCSLLDEKIVYQSFFGAPLTFSYFLLQGKVLCFARVGKSLVRCLLSNVSKTLSKKLYLQLYLTQIFQSNSKMLFL